jgi:DeoR/GlpR family transcriptional regulator of sugar metabolism
MRKKEKNNMNKQEILEKAKSRVQKSEKVYISDWDCEVIVREINAKEYVDISSECLDNTGNDVDRKKYMNYMIISSLYSIDGERLFTNDDINIIENMGAESFAVIFQAVDKLNNLTGSNKNPKNLKKAAK